MKFLAASLLLFVCSAAQASVGLMELPGLDGDDAVTVFYPSDADAKPVERGPFTVNAALQGAPRKGNGRLIVISHGSGGSAWTYTDLAWTLVGAGFTVAFPLHRGDSYKSTSDIGPASWRRRPAEVSRAIDAVGKDARLAPLLQLDKVGVYGMSAGGHTALSFAGGRWSPAQLKKHCEAHIAEDFATCVGPGASLTGGMSDGFKKSVSLWIIAWRLSDAAWVSYDDPRVKAAVAGVPFAVDFDMQSLATPRIPLGLVVAGKDVWLTPRFHSDALRAACKTCELVADIPDGAHGALLSPLPPGLSGRLGELINDPPGFDRKQLPEVDRKITAFFQKHL